MEHSCWCFCLLCSPQCDSLHALYASRGEWTHHNGTHKPVTCWKAARGAPCSWGFPSTVLNTNYRPSAEEWRDPAGLKETSSLLHRLLRFLLSAPTAQFQKNYVLKEKQHFLNFPLKWRCRTADLRSWHKIWIVYFIVVAEIWLQPPSGACHTSLKMKIQAYNYDVSCMLFMEPSRCPTTCHYVNVEVQTMLNECFFEEL